jgi:hypothetical protein
VTNPAEEGRLMAAALTAAHSTADRLQLKSFPMGYNVILFCVRLAARSWPAPRHNHAGKPVIALQEPAEEPTQAKQSAA